MIQHLRTCTYGPHCRRACVRQDGRTAFAQNGGGGRKTAEEVRRSQKGILLLKRAHLSCILFGSGRRVKEVEVGVRFQRLLSIVRGPPRLHFFGEPDCLGVTGDAGKGEKKLRKVYSIDRMGERRSPFCSQS